MSSHQRQRVRRHFSRTQPQTAQTSSRSATTWRENFRQRSRVSNSSRIASCSLSLNILNTPRTFSWFGAIERPREPVRPYKNLFYGPIPLFSLCRSRSSSRLRFGVVLAETLYQPPADQLSSLSSVQFGTSCTKRTQVRKLRSLVISSASVQNSRNPSAIRLRQGHSA